MSSSNKGERVFLLILMAIIFAAAWLLWRGYREGPRGTGDPVGAIETAVRISERRGARSSRWFKADSAAVIYNRDTIRTGSRSETLVRLKDGTELRIGEDSMVVIDISAGTTLSLAAGSVRVSSSGAAGPVRLRTAEGEALLDGGRLSVEQRDGRTAIVLEQGAGRFVSNSENEKDGDVFARPLEEEARYVPSSGESIPLPPEELSPPLPPVEAPLLMWPVGQRLFAADYPHPQAFSWTGSPEVGEYRVRVWREGEESETLERLLSRNDILLELPSSGNWIWEVEALPAGVRSARGRFELHSGSVPAPVLETLTSLPGDLAEGMPLVRWESIAGISSWQIAVHDAGAPQEAVYTETSTRNAFLHQASMGPGSWLVTVRGLTKGGILGESAGVTVVLKPPVPLVPLEPASGAAIPLRARFAWENPNGGTRYRLRVSTSATLEPPFHEEFLSKTMAEVNTLDFPIGALYWGVDLLDPEGDILASTAAKGIYKPLLLNAPVLRNPVSGAEFDPGVVESLLFSWDPVEGASLYELRIRRQLSGGEEVLRSIRVPEPTWRLDDLAGFSGGRFVWSVTALADVDSKREAKSDTVQSVFSFREKKALVVPKILRVRKKGLY